MEDNYCGHEIRICNFNDKEIVTYPIVCIIGIINLRENGHLLYKNTENNLVVKTTSSSSKIIKDNLNIKDNKFKLLIELTEGENFINFTCKNFKFSLEYRPNFNEFTIMPMYVICEGHDGHFQAPLNENNDINSACSRILLGAKLLQCFTAEKLKENGFERKTFNLENNCKVFRSKLNFLEARKLSQKELWKKIGTEIMQSTYISSSKRKYLAFLSCTHYNSEKYSNELSKTFEDLLKITEAYVALGGGGLALFGSASLYTWPENFNEISARFENTIEINKSEFLDHSSYRGTFGSCFSTTLGAVLHELYHTLDLGHTESGIMGTEFNDINKFFTLEDVDQLLLVDSEKNILVKKFQDNNSDFLTKSGASILNYHKWLNNYPDVKYFKAPVNFDSANNLIKADFGIRVIELRKSSEEMLLSNWTFLGKVLKFSFQIPQEFLNEQKNLVLFVEDNHGNILKKYILN